MSSTTTISHHKSLTRPSNPPSPIPASQPAVAVDIKEPEKFSERLKQIREALDCLQPVEESLRYLQMLRWPIRLRGYEGLIYATRFEETLTEQQRNHLSKTLQDIACRSLDIDNEKKHKETGPYHFAPDAKYKPFKEELHRLEHSLVSATGTTREKLLTDLNVLEEGVNTTLFKVRNLLMRSIYTNIFPKDEEHIRRQMGNPEWRQDIINDFQVIRSQLVVIQQYTGLSLDELKVARETHKDQQSNSDVKLEKIKNLAIDQLDALKVDVPVIVNALIEIELRRINIFKLWRIDQQRRNQINIAGYLLISILIPTLLLVFGFIGNIFTIDQRPLALQVVIWSLIGSIAALFQRFNHSLIGSWRVFFRQVLVRPAQGVVLGAAFYLIVHSGLLNLSALGGGTANQANDQPTEVINALTLVLAFLIGFSDTFTDWIFNTLVGSYTKKKEEEKNLTKD